MWSCPQLPLRQQGRWGAQLDAGSLKTCLLNSEDQREGGARGHQREVHVVAVGLGYLWDSISRVCGICGTVAVRPVRASAELGLGGVATESTRVS